MIKFPQMCKKCETFLFELAAKDGGLVFCSHLSNSSASGVFVAAVPVEGGGKCQLHIIYPCTESEAKEKARKMMSEMKKTEKPTHD